MFAFKARLSLDVKLKRPCISAAVDVATTTTAKTAAVVAIVVDSTTSSTIRN